MGRVSKDGCRFIADHEGRVNKAYRDPIGVVTIGVGFTNRSKAFLSYWKKKYGRPLRMGDYISNKEMDDILSVIIDAEYGKAVNRDISSNLPQHQHDAMCSFTFNLGPGAAKWRPGRFLKTGNIKAAANAMRSGYNTAAGKVFRGLTRRRKEEANLLEHGDYGFTKISNVEPKPVKVVPALAPKVREYQEKLKQLGYNPGPIDGEYGPLTEASVLKFQKTHPSLKNDGVLGKATASTINRALKAAKKFKVDVPAAVGVGTVVTTLPEIVEVTDKVSYISGILQSMAPIAVILFVGFIAWRFRDEIRQFISKIFNKNKPTDVEVQTDSDEIELFEVDL